MENSSIKQLYMEAALLFIKTHKNKSLSIDQQISSLHRERVARNRLILWSIVEAIILCGRQGLALRGHRDDTKHVEQNRSPITGISLPSFNFVSIREIKCWKSIYKQPRKCTVYE